MGHKVNPIGLRLGINRTWDSCWFARKDDYARLLHDDLKMRKILKEIQSGKFAREWIRESESGGANFKRLLEADLKQPIEKVGTKLRARMPWLQATR